MTSPTDSPRSAAEAVEALRASATKGVAAVIYERLAEQLAPFGEPGRRRCLEDLNWHIDFLLGAVMAEDSRPFLDYLAWLGDLMRVYGVADDTVALSVDGLADFFRQRLTPRDWGVVQPILAEAQQRLRSPGGVRTGLPADDSAQGQLRDALVDSLLGGDHVRAAALVHRAVRELGYLGMAVCLIQPAMRRVGELWQQREISVAQEHLASEVVRRLLSQEFAQADASEPVGRSVLLACVSGNRHELGLRILADAFELRGWDTHFLGADTPSKDLVAAVERIRPELVALSISLGRQIPALREVATAVRKGLGPQAPRIIAGGPCVTGLHHVCRRLGLDACYTDAAAVPELAP